MQTHSRRQALRLLGGGALGALLAACGARPPETIVPSPQRDTAVDALRVVPPAPPPPPAPTPRPVPARGRIERTLLAGSEWATPLVITHSGVEGPRVMVLGGVHGNEPGGWLAAEAIADWQPEAGSLLVVPRANVLSTHEFVRTLDGFGDLNRLYPGRPESVLPMSRMAATITAAAREFEVDLLFDLHESWGFFAEYADDERGTATLGQTVTKGSGPFELADIVAAVGAVNEQVSKREQLILRDRRFGRGGGGFGGFGGDPTFGGGFSSGSSSLSLGSYVPGLTAVLIEMGQQRQPEWRRAELHQLFVRATLER
ncbi:MAG: succinylglutamate desuccinylase/aspartoacylase family protein, partial [Dehalococcoidia bacterium]